MEDKHFDIEEFEIFFDYLCPFVYRAAIWMKDVEDRMGRKLPIRWRYFSLEQVNRKDREKNVWDADYGMKTRGIQAFKAAEAIRKQGEELFLRFHLMLLESFHKGFTNISDIEVLKGVAAKAGADVARFSKDMEDPSMIDQLVKDHNMAVNILEIFGTPTFVFEGDSPVYLKLESPDFPDSVEFFREFVRIAVDRQNVLEIKRP